MTMIIITHQHR